MELTPGEAIELIRSILMRTGPAQGPLLFPIESTGQLQCLETVVGPGRREFETDSAEHSPSTMIQIHRVRCRQLPRKRRQTKKTTQTTQMDIQDIHRGSKLTLHLLHAPLAGSPGQHPRWDAKKEKNPLPCHLIHTEPAIGMRHHLHQRHLIEEPMVWTKKNLRFKGLMGGIPTHLC